MGLIVFVLAMFAFGIVGGIFLALLLLIGAAIVGIIQGFIDAFRQLGRKIRG